jgi:hemerythrin superfamily protein
LTEDHARVKKMFKQYDKLAQSESDESERQELASMICAELTAHATAEEEIFYPAARKVLNEVDLLDEAEVEHASAKELIAQIQEASPDDELFDAKVKVLGEYINHHVQEEEGEMFPKVRKANSTPSRLASKSPPARRNHGRTGYGAGGSVIRLPAFAHDGRRCIAAYL